MSAAGGLGKPIEEPVRTEALTALPFQAAAEAWLETRKPYISAKTHHEYRLNIITLSKFFAEMHLPEITPDLLRAYQKMRMSTCGASAINHECSVIQQMLKRIGRWQDISGDYQPLALPKEQRGRALSGDEYVRLFRAAQASPNWEAAWLFAVISVNTTCGPKETATLRFKDVDLDKRLIQVQPEGAKNVHRLRVIPLNEDAYEAVTRAIRRARELGSFDRHHYIFPFRIHRGCYDPTRHQTTFKTAWREVTATASLGGLRMYDLRHHAITTLLENPEVSDETAEAVAGHISERMKKKYSHIRIEYRRAAVEALNRKPPKKPQQKSTDTQESTEVGQQLLSVLSKLLKTI